MYLSYDKVRNVSNPEKGYPLDAGIDLFVPKFDKEFIKDFKSLSQNKDIEIVLNDLSIFGDQHIILAPGESCLIPSGIVLCIPPGTMGLFLNKSGVASKMNLLVGSQVIDPFYDGECHINLHNVGVEKVNIREDSKIVQLIIVPIIQVLPQRIIANDIYENYKSSEYRKANGFGSTDKK